MNKSPVNVTRATVLWTGAVVAGVVESILAVSRIAADDGLDAGVWANLGFRCVVYGLAAFLILRFARGRRWARTSLTVLLSVVGLASMVVPAASELAGGASIVEALGGNVAFVAVRSAHIVFVIAATVLMYTGTANRYFAKGSSASTALPETASTR